MKKCTNCGETKPFSKFHRKNTARDGRQSWCAQCRNRYNRAQRQTAKGRRYYRRYQRDNFYCDPDYKTKMQARNAVNGEVRQGRMPRVNTRKCNRCGQQADHYHHHKGYDKEHRLDVIPLCIDCHVEEEVIT